MEGEVTVEVIRLAELFPTFHIVSLSLLALLILMFFTLGLKKIDLKFQWLLSSLSIWIGLFGGILFTIFWFNIWRETHFRGYPKDEHWVFYQMESYFRLAVYLSLALVSWTLAIALKLINEKKRQQVEPIVTTPVDEVEAQSTQAHP